MTLTDFSSQLRQVNTEDVKLEVLLAELYFSGLNPLREVLVHPAGLFARDFRRDVGRVDVGHANILQVDAPPPDPRVLDSDLQDFLNIEVHRDGLYDYLPEGLFHQATGYTRDQAEVFAEIDEQGRRRAAARRFFQPIEQEFYLQRLLLELEERKYDVTEDNLRQNPQADILRSFWGIPADLLTVRQLNNLLHLLPIAQRIVTNTELARQCFELVLGVSVQLRTIPPLMFAIELVPGDVPPSDELSRAELGNFSLDGLYQDTMPAIEIRIGPLNSNQMNDFLANGRNRAILNLLTGYFLPAESQVVDHLIAGEDNQFLVLVDDDPSSVLGIASYI